MEVKDQIKQRVPITEVASLYVDLKPAGKYFKALCPFHTEKTPSFFVNPEKGSFTCYGCNQFGDIFTLIQELENVAFPEAMNFLIEKFHVPVEKTGRRGGGVDKDAYAVIMKAAQQYFRANLSDTPEGKNAQDYLRRRGLNAATVDRFAMGYAQNTWEGLYRHLQDRKLDIAKAEELGLLIRNPRKNSLYDRFRGRIIFPIFSESGALIAFGGRTVFDEPNKYLNSPDTPIYKKSHHLYAFDLAKPSIREKKSVILVEGYFDVVSLQHHGVGNVVASLGTALTENQVYLLKRFSDTIYIYYDGDKAGITATVRAIEKMFEQNINPRVIAPPPGAKDPDDFIRENGLKGLNQLLEDAKDGFRFLLGYLARFYDLSVPEQKNKAVEKMMEVTTKFGEPIIRDEYIRMTADFFQVDEARLKIKSREPRRVRDNDAGAPAKPLVITPAEHLFLRAVLALPVLIEKYKDVFNERLSAVLASQNIVRLLLRYYNPHTRSIDDYGTLVRQLNAPEQAVFRETFRAAEAVEKDADALDRDAEASVMKFIDIFNKQEFRRIDQRIKIAERENNTQEALRLTREKYKYIKMKHNKQTGGSVELL